jgi:hypothetical protein
MFHALDCHQSQVQTALQLLRGICSWALRIQRVQHRAGHSKLSKLHCLTAPPSPPSNNLLHPPTPPRYPHFANGSGERGQAVTAAPCDDRNPELEVDGVDGVG